MASVTAPVPLHVSGARWRQLQRAASTPGAVVALAVLLGVVLGTAIGLVVGPGAAASGATTSTPAATAGGPMTSTGPASTAVAAVTVVAGVTAVADAPVATTGTLDAGGATPAGAFTLGELAAGEVPVERFVAFWETELERIGTAACPAAVGAGSTVVTMSVGATPPAELGGAYPDYAPLLAAAHDAAAARCGG